MLPVFEQQMNDSPISRVAVGSRGPPEQPSSRYPLPLIWPLSTDRVLAGAFQTDELAHDEVVDATGFAHASEPALDDVGILHFPEMNLQRCKCLRVGASRRRERGCECLERIAQPLGPYPHSVEVLHIRRGFSSSYGLAQPAVLPPGGSNEILYCNLVYVGGQSTTLDHFEFVYNGHQMSIGQRALSPSQGHPSIHLQTRDESGHC